MSEQVHPKADITAGIWAYHFGYDNRGWPSMEPAAKLINETGGYWELPNSLLCCDGPNFILLGGESTLILYHTL